ncbi:MAG: hypothetical protein ACLTE2_12385 [Eubacteriales bacterium]
MKKIISLAAVAAMAAVCALPTFAYTNSTEAVNETQNISANETAQTSVYAEVGSSFTVTIPKKITLSGETKSGTYNVTCTGDIAGDEFVSVAPDASFEMSQKGKDDVTATVAQEITKFRADNYTTELVSGEAKMATGATGSITASGLTSGGWNGNFNFTIALSQDSNI